jgi:hypothetical protein
VFKIDDVFGFSICVKIILQVMWNTSLNRPARLLLADGLALDVTIGNFVSI